MSETITVASGTSVMWQATSELRFLARGSALQQTRILQQKWFSDDGHEEWRDVPMVEEGA